MIELTDQEIDEMMVRVWERIIIKLTHIDILFNINPMEETLDKCNCGKKKPPKK